MSQGWLAQMGKHPLSPKFFEGTAFNTAGPAFFAHGYFSTDRHGSDVRNISDSAI